MTDITASFYIKTKEDWFILKQHIIFFNKGKNLYIKNEYIKVSLYNDDYQKQLDVLLSDVDVVHKYLKKKKILSPRRGLRRSPPVKFTLDLCYIEIGEYGNFTTTELVKFCVDKIGISDHIEFYDELLQYACEYNNEIIIEFALEEINKEHIFFILYNVYCEYDISFLIFKLFIDQLWKRYNRDEIIEIFTHGFYRKDGIMYKIIENDDVGLLEYMVGEDEHELPVDVVIDIGYVVSIIKDNAKSIILFLKEHGSEMCNYFLNYCCHFNNVTMCKFILKNVPCNDKALTQIFLENVGIMSVDIAKLFVNNGINVWKNGNLVRKKTKEAKNHLLEKYLDKIM